MKFRIALIVAGLAVIAFIYSVAMHRPYFMFSPPPLTPPPAQTPPSPPPTASGDSGITGAVLLGPTCPVQRVPLDPQCADKPFQTTLYILEEPRLITTGQGYPTKADGTFRIILPPGQYFVQAGDGEQIYPRCKSQDVTVSAHYFTDITISCDTGIR